MARTARPVKPVRWRSRRVAAVAKLRKPFGIDLLVRTVERLVGDQAAG